MGRFITRIAFNALVMGFPIGCFMGTAKCFTGWHFLTGPIETVLGIFVMLVLFNCVMVVVVIGSIVFECSRAGQQHLISTEIAHYFVRLDMGV